ncbi:type II toxin-antitoxin system RelE/ParE family toxin [bacterium]|nr:type II toxin-antitoxin system RelE/ParE family toxin [bacterium]
MKIHFTTQSKSDIAEIVEYFFQDNPQEASNWANSLFDSIKQLYNFPEIGRIVPEYSEVTIREIIIGLYRIVYNVW